MAAANITAAEELMSCPVCFEHYTDPRSLKCIHHFCLECLEKVATKPTKYGKREITCPTCRAVTPLTPGSQVRDLPKPLVANDLQEMIKKLLMSETKEKSYTCDNCEGKSEATIHCFGCKENMCDACYTEHQDAAELTYHKAAPISDFIFCGTHHEEVTLYCYDCKAGICNRCVRKEHKNHAKEDIGTVAQESRYQVGSFINIQETSTISPDMIKQAEGTLQEVASLRDTVVGKLDHTLDLIKTLEDKVKKIRSEVVTKTSADINVLKLYISDLSELIASQASLVELGQYLVEKASDPEVVARATELPSPTSMASVTSPPTVSIPSIELATMEEMLKKLNEQAKVNYNLVKCPCAPDRTNVVHVPEVPALIHQHSYHPGSAVYGVLCNHTRSQLVVKSMDESAPIKVYDLRGNKFTQFGGDIDGLTENGCMSLDSHRDLYLAACYENLTTLTMDGKRKDRIDMEGCNLSGVTYIMEDDLYVVSDVTNHKIMLIDPRTKSVVRSIGSKGTRPGQFQIPAFLTTYTDQGKPVIVVSDIQNHRVQLLDLYGTHLHTYGSEGGAPGQLCDPHGVAADPTGRIIVCDYSNKRVVSFWTEDGQDKWQCLIPQLAGKPYCVDIDTTHETMAVEVNNTVTLYTCNGGP